jgi:Fic family protein
MPFIHEQAAWPAFRWSSRTLSPLLAAVRHKQGCHLGRMGSLGSSLRAEAGLIALTDEIVGSSAIEGEHLDASAVRSSIARRLGLDAAGLPEPGRTVDAVVEMMLDATRAHDLPLTAERLFGWHAALFPTGRSGPFRLTVGGWRTDEKGPMQVVSGPIGRETVHFQAPDAHRLEREMACFLDWFETAQAIDPVLKAGIAHFWFVTVHPFDDGNGRIARAIADMALARADQAPDRYYSMSSAIHAQRRSYYRKLESAQRGGLDITAWLTWFLECLDRTLDDAEESLRSVLDKAHLWRKINTRPVNDRQRKVVNRMLDSFKGHLTTSKYAKLAKCSNDTALRDIRELLRRGILVKNPGGGRSTSYRLARSEEIEEITD